VTLGPAASAGCAFRQEFEEMDAADRLTLKPKAVTMLSGIVGGGRPSRYQARTR